MENVLNLMAEAGLVATIWVLVLGAAGFFWRMWRD